jgi:hypothetical protein
MGFERPKKIERARKQGDIEALSRMGRAGGFATAEVKRKKKIRAETLEEIRAEEKVKTIEDFNRAGNYDILTPEGKDPNSDEEE